jgi:putative flippase GtrA
MIDAIPREASSGVKRETLEVDNVLAFTGAMTSHLTTTTNVSILWGRLRLSFFPLRFVQPAPPIKFLLVGVANTAVGLAVIWSAKLFFGADDVAANGAGYAIGLTMSFLLNKRWTFSFRGDGRAALLRFAVVFGVAYSANLCTVVVLIKLTGLDPFWCQALGIIPYSSLFYLGSRRYAFPINTEENASKKATGTRGAHANVFRL